MYYIVLKKQIRSSLSYPKIYKTAKKIVSSPVFKLARKISITPPCDVSQASELALQPHFSRPECTQKKRRTERETYKEDQWQSIFHSILYTAIGPIKCTKILLDNRQISKGLQISFLSVFTP